MTIQRSLPPRPPALYQCKMCEDTFSAEDIVWWADPNVWCCSDCYGGEDSEPMTLAFADERGIT